MRQVVHMYIRHLVSEFIEALTMLILFGRRVIGKFWLNKTKEIGK